MRDAVLTPLAFAWAASLCVSLAPLEGCAKLKPEGDIPDAGPACKHRQPPGPPEMKDGGGTLDLYLAVSRADFGTYSMDDAGRPRYQNLGWDLDNTCTGEGQGPSCIEPPWVPRAHYQDGVDGIDNAFGISWWQKAADFVTTDPGHVAALIRVQQYNGMPNDDRVEVSLYYSLGLSAREDGQVGPLWDGEDRWKILPDSLKSPEAGSQSLDQPKYVDSRAYVTNGVLVASFEDGLSPAYLSTLPSHLWQVHRGVVAGPLSQTDNGPWELDAVAGFRVALTVVAQASVTVIADPSQNPVCQSTDLQKYLRNACSYIDIAYDDDSPSAMCDALSTGYTFHAIQALPGELASPLQEYPTCDFSMYSCDFADH